MGGGCTNLYYFYVIFAENCMKMKKNGLRGPLRPLDPLLQLVLGKFCVTSTIKWRKIALFPSLSFWLLRTVFYCDIFKRNLASVPTIRHLLPKEAFTLRASESVNFL